MSEYPTNEQLKQIEEWDYKNFESLAKYVQSIWHWGEDYSPLEDWKEDKLGRQYRMFRLITGGWSGNEDIIQALNKNTMFDMLCWQASFRGGLHIYHIREFDKD
jgi:hypothetical protein